MHLLNRFSYNRLRNIVITELERFTYGPTSFTHSKEDKISGILIVLTALVGCSNEIFNAYPHLDQE